MAAKVAEIREVRSRARCLYSEREVEAALDTMAEQVSTHLADKNPLLLCIMNGGLIVTGKLATRLDFPLQLDYLHATRYREKTRGAELQWQKHPNHSLAGRHVLVIDDILDEGITLSAISNYCKDQGAAEVLCAVLVEKDIGQRPVSIDADFVGLRAENAYLFGYGMDYKGYLRNAPGIFAVAAEDMG
ncbi:MAG: hypoxanthine-guanine phosphoribosyltransferase [Gammaproteobacteria bacterium]